MIKIILAAMLLSPVSAYAYLDPGTGSLIIQAFIAGIASLVATWGLFKAKIKSIFSDDKQNSDPLSDDSLEKAAQENNRKDNTISKDDVISKDE